VLLSELMAAGQLSRFHHKGPVASKFAGSKPNGLLHACVGAILQAYCKVKTKPKKQSPNSRKRFRLSGATCHRERLTFDTAVKDFSERLKACVGAGGGHFVNIHSDNTEFWHLIIS